MTALFRRFVSWWKARPCRVCQGSGWDEGFAFGLYFNIPCCFCEAGDRAERAMLDRAAQHRSRA
jgi:hypothetical protein